MSIKAKEFFLRQARPPYGARIFICFYQVERQRLNELSIWKGPDKEFLDVKAEGWEFHEKEFNQAVEYLKGVGFKEVKDLY